MVGAKGGKKLGVWALITGGKACHTRASSSVAGCGSVAGVGVVGAGGDRVTERQQRRRVPEVEGRAAGPVAAAPALGAEVDEAALERQPRPPARDVTEDADAVDAHARVQPAAKARVQVGLARRRRRVPRPRGEAVRPALAVRAGRRHDDEGRCGFPIVVEGWRCP